jgi:hypothetical protein
MLFMNGDTAVKISNRARHFKDTGIGAGGEPEAVGDQFQHAIAGGIEFAVFFDEAWSHLGVAVYFGPFVAFQLDFTGVLHPFGDGCRTFRFSPVGEVTVFDSRDFDVNVDTVKQRAGDAGTVAVNSHRSAGAGVGWVGKIPTGTGVC